MFLIGMKTVSVSYMKRPLLISPRVLPSKIKKNKDKGFKRVIVILFRDHV